ncbi:MAG: hypothetical protein J4473_04395 [Candidatus Aenigmarchaeota archaeon]|nr:hypothetical protein [Candidatus Aenigmarchaeota archaeon]
MKIDNAEQFLSEIGAPRPHYLIGPCEYTADGDKHYLRATALFSSDKSPSVYDRAMFEDSHVNVGDAYFALWNGIHIMISQNGLYNTLAGTGKFHPKKLILPDTEIDLEIEVTPKSYNDNVMAHYRATFSLNGEELLELSGNGVAEKKKA